MTRIRTVFAAAALAAMALGAPAVAHASQDVPGEPAVVVSAEADELVVVVDLVVPEVGNGEAETGLGWGWGG
ncbi:hypothetical protein GCM10023153_19240 [Ornithinibacter aureus]|uniref:Uncharacterized protein n=1 Tax=Ornithinibacter aureus TaxID=622664 RepID=A0ABP8JVD6_9MICO|nr:hypothetical protein [Ornithinibacter aureus]